MRKNKADSKIGKDKLEEQFSNDVCHILNSVGQDKNRSHNFVHENYMLGQAPNTENRI